MKRLRGWLLRLVLKRTVSIILGAALVAPAAWMLLGEYGWETPTTDGLGLILGATGAALLIQGIGGRRPDWEEESRK